jgi:peptide/nickel transport system ATP-binding protein/oligopeptide transport system ATP-binding protein
MSEELIRVNQLKKYYPVYANKYGSSKTRQLLAVDDVSFSIKKGQIYGVVGESGCGKSTLGRCLLRLVDLTEGNIYFKGEDISLYRHRELKRVRHQMQMVFQNPFSSFNPKMTIGQSLFEIGKFYKIPKDDTKIKIKQLLEHINLQDDALYRYPNELSGGQLQRLAIARALMLDPLFIIADEPVSALDVSVQAQILNLILDLRDKLSLTLLFISHELTVVEHVCDRVAVMYMGKIVEEASTVEIFSKKKHPYTEALISARPKEDPEQKTDRIILEGELPSAIDIPRGCRFFSRCPKFQKGRCDEEVPLLKEIAPEHLVACHLV